MTDDAELTRLLGAPPRLALDDIVRHPRLAEAQQIHLDYLLEAYSGNPFVVRLLIESGRYLVHVVTVVLEAAHDPSRRETWVTVGLLKQTIAQFGLASGRHVDHLVARLCATGYLELLPAERDRRVRIVKPTEAMHAHDRQSFLPYFKPLAALYPQYDYGLALQDDSGIHKAVRRAGLPLMPLSARLLRSMPDMLLFFDRAGGVMVIAALLKAALAEGDSHAAVSYADVGAQFGVSRTHVHKLLLAAADVGLVKLHARGGRRVEILPRMWASHAHSIACGMFLHNFAYELALREPQQEGHAASTPSVMPAPAAARIGKRERSAL